MTEPVRLCHSASLSLPGTWLGGCPGIGIWVKIEKFPENKHSHIVDIGVYAYLRALFSGNSEEFEQKALSDGLLGFVKAWYQIRPNMQLQDSNRLQCSLSPPDQPK
jgi:hypothetical protein